MTRVWDPQKQDWVEQEGKVIRLPAPEPKKHRWDLLFIAIGLTVVVVVVLITYLIVGEGTGQEAPASTRTASTGPVVEVPSPSTVELGGSPVRADSMTASMLAAYHTGGPEALEFVRYDLERMTSCNVSGVVDDWTEEELAEQVDELQGLFPSSKVGAARDRGLSMVAVYVCP